MKLPKMTAAYFCGDGQTFFSSRNIFTPRRPLPMHTQDFAEVFWVERGAGIHTINGQRQPVTAGTLSLIRPTDCHGLRVAPGTSELVVLNVNVPMPALEYVRGDLPKGADCFWTSTAQPFTVQVDAATLAWLTEWSAEIADYWRAGGFFLRNFLSELLLRIQNLSPQAPVAPAWLQRALAAVSAPRHFKGGTPAFVRLTGRSARHVNLVLRQHCGLTTTEVVNRARMRYAAEELVNSDKKIIDICMECGFNNLGHFHRLFRQHYQTTPNNYRGQHRSRIEQS